MLKNRFWQSAVLAAAVAGSSMVMAADTIKVGVLHSLSGTMAISETTLKDTMLMLIEEQNKKDGILGKQLEAVVVDPASNWPLFAEKARELIEKDEVAAIFGCWTSVSRKSILPVVEELDSVVFYPVPVSYTHLRAHETKANLVCRLLLEQKINPIVGRQ